MNYKEENSILIEPFGIETQLYHQIRDMAFRF